MGLVWARGQERTRRRAGVKVEFVDPRKAGVDRLEAAVRVCAWHYEQGRRVVLATGDKRLVGEADQRLWTFDPGSFVAHGVWQGRGELDEPVVVSAQIANPNRAQVLVSLVLPEGKEEEFSWVVVVLPEKQEELEPYRAYYKQMKSTEGVEVFYTQRLPSRM